MAVLILGCLAVVSGMVYFLHTRGILYETVYLPSIDPSFRAHSLNDHGQIVLSSHETKAYWLCDPRRGNVHIRAHARNISARFEAVALNNRGWILGRDSDPDNAFRWLMLKPIREN